MSEWKEVQENNVWQFKAIEDKIEGILVNKQPKTKDISARYYIDMGNNIMMVWGTTVLDARMMNVQVGQQVRITYKGKQENNKKTVHIFKVEVKV